MRVIYDFNRNHIRQLHRLYQNEWWSRGRTLEQTQRCVQGSQVCIGLEDSNANLVGFVRVLTDYVFKAILFDVIVEASVRGNGLGSQLIELVKSHQQLDQVQHFELYGLPDRHAFYQSHGFTTELGDITLMRFTRQS